MYEKFMRSGSVSILMLCACAALAFLIVYIYTDSIILPLLVAFSVIVIWNFAFWRGLDPRRKMVDLIISGGGFKSTEDRPLLDDEDSDFARKQNRKVREWRKGIGFTGDIDQPMWVTADECGVILYYLCYASKSPILVPWERIMKIAFNESSTEGEADTSARLYVPGVGTTVMVPWQSDFDKHIPEGVMVK